MEEGKQEKSVIHQSPVNFFFFLQKLFDKHEFLINISSVKYHDAAAVLKTWRAKKVKKDSAAIFFIFAKVGPKLFGFRQKKSYKLWRCSDTMQACIVSIQIWMMMMMRVRKTWEEKRKTFGE
jgi:hypothetical protein